VRSKRASSPWPSSTPISLRRASLVAEASRALWLFVVQREACGLRDLRYVLRDYRVPHEVAARMGALPHESHTPKRDP